MPAKKKIDAISVNTEQERPVKASKKAQTASGANEIENAVPDGTKIKESSERIPEPQTRVFNYNGMDFVILDETGDGMGVIAISADILENRMRFADNNDYGSNDWRKSTIRKKLNTEYIKKFNQNDLLPILSDLTADTGEDNFGMCEDYIALPSDSMIRKFNKVIPSYNTWIWTITPWAIDYSNMSAVGARTQAKTIYSEQPNRELGVAIVCIFKKEVIDVWVTT